MTASTPRTDAVNSATSTQSFEGLCRTLERELAQVTDTKNYHNNERIRVKQLAEEAESENAALLALVEEIKGRVQFGVSTHRSSDIVKMCNEAIAKGKK